LSNVLLLTSAHERAAEILPSLSLLPHAVKVAHTALLPVSGGPAPDAILVDARRDLVQAKKLLQTLRATAPAIPVLVIVTEGGLAAVSADWAADDLVLPSAGPGEIEARLRLAIGRATASSAAESPEIRAGELVVNEASYSARLGGRTLDLTFKEFELLKFLAQHPGRVFTRAQLLQEVWGYDYFGGTRTVDVHVRRLRAKLGAEHEQMIGTVRNVGYRFSAPRPGRGLGDDKAAGPGRAPAAAPGLRAPDESATAEPQVLGTVQAIRPGPGQIRADR
jgi:DNA-binding response OmpR family regulator